MKTRSDSSIRVLLRIPAFRRLWAAITVSSFGDWMGLLATTSLAAYLTRDASSLVQGAAVSGVLLTRLAPDLILGPVAGSVVDRLDRRTVAIVGDTLAGLLYLSIVFAGNLTWLLVAQFLVEAVGLFSNPAKQAMWVNIVPRERLAVANQLNYVSIYGMVPIAAVVFALLSTVAQFFGAPVVPSAAESTSLLSGGPTSAVVINIALVIDAATYFTAAATVLASRRIIPSYLGERTAARGILPLIAEGISFISHNRVMRAIYIGILGAFSAGGLVAGVAQLYVSALGAGTAGYGILFGSVFTGLALGMLIGPKVLPTVPRRIIFTSSIGAAGVMLVVMSLMGDFVGAVIASAVLGLFAGIAWINGFTMIGQEVADKLRGRVFAFVMSSVRITLLATIALGPVLAGFIGAHEVTVGEFQWVFSGSAVVLAIGGVVAIVVGLFAGRQVGGGAASRSLRRALRRRGGGLWDRPAEHQGLLIAVEGHDPVLVGMFQDAIVEHVRSAGYRAIAERPEVGWSAPPSFSVLSSQRAGAPGGGSSSGGPLNGGPSNGGPLNGGPSNGGPSHGHTGTMAVEEGSGDENAESARQSPADALRGLAALSERVSGRIRPDLDLGSVVVSSDYVDAAVVRYGVCGGLDEEQVLQTALWAVNGLLPDLTVLVDVPVQVSRSPEAGASEAAGSRPAGLGADALPVGERVDALPAGEGAGVGPAEEGADVVPVGVVVDADPAEVVVDADPAEVVVDAAPGLDLDQADPVPTDEPIAYRERASTAPERYVVVRPTPGSGSALDVELAARVDSVLRLRAPELAEPVVAGHRDGRDAA